MPPQGGAKEAGIARRFCCAGFPAGNGRRLLSLQGKGLRPIFFTCSHPGLAALRAAPRGITRRLRAAKTRPRTNGSGGAAGKFPAEQTEKDAEAAFPKTSPGKRIATSAGAGDLPAFAPSAACPPVGVSARRRVRPSARPPGRLRGRGRTKPAAQVQRRGRSMSQKVFSCKELSKDRFVHQSIIGADASCLQRVRLSAKSEQGLILPSPFQSCTSDRPPKCQVYADRTCTWQYLPLSCGAKPPFPSRHGTGPAVCV